MSDTTVEPSPSLVNPSHLPAFLTPDELGDLRADIARYLIKKSLLAEAVGVSDSKLSQYLNGRTRLARSLGETIRAALDSLKESLAESQA